MRKPCDLCEAIPLWMEGHRDLFVSRSDVGHDPVFKCRACGQTWRRHHLAGGTFSWHPARRIRDKSESRGHVALQARRLKLVKAFVEARLADPLRMQDLADVVQLSPFHFARAFKAETGVTPHQFVLNARLVRSQQLLLTPSILIGEVARRVGFPRPGDFTKAFVRRFGTTPRAYRLQMWGSRRGERAARAAPGLSARSK